MSQEFIPYSLPWITDREIEAVVLALREGRIASNGANMQSTKNVLKRFTSGHDVLLTTSCTSALDLALRCFDLQPDDEVIVPSFTFVSTANVVLQCGARPTFIDIEEQTLNLDLSQLPSTVSSHTRGIIPVHYNSISCDMDVLLQYASDRELFVVEDAAHAIGALYRGNPLGTIGDIGCFSFHDTKNCVAGEGGAAVLNNCTLADRADSLYEKGTDRSRFLRGEIDKYTWVSPGGSYALSAVLAQLLRVQLERFGDIRAGRKAIDDRYRQGLSRLQEEGIIRFVQVPEYATPNYHLSYFLVSDSARRDPLLAHLRHCGIGACFHYVPLHLSPYGQSSLCTRPGQFPVTEKVASSIVRLPLYPQLHSTSVDYIIAQVLNFFHPSSTSTHVSVSYGDTRASVTASLDLSVIIACYNEAPHLHHNLDEILHILDVLQVRYEIIIIDDCSQDETQKRISEYVSLHPQHRFQVVFHERNQGRGATVSQGIRMARGTFVGFIDIDLEIPARYIPSALTPLFAARADVVIADRHYKLQPLSLHRHIMSAGYRWLAQRMLKIPSTDTEAGFKFFRHETILPVLDEVRDGRWFWDTEICVRSLDHGLRIHREQVLFNRKRGKASTVKALRDSWRSFVALLHLRRSRKDPLISPRSSA